MNKYSENKLKSKLNNITKTNAIISQLHIPKNETLIFIFQIIKIKQNINFYYKVVVSRDFQTPVYRIW